MKKDFNGYEWGWIKADGKREDSGTATSVKMSEVIGVWGRYFRKGIQRPCYRETLISELPEGTVSPLETVQSENLQQCMKFAYPKTRYEFFNLRHVLSTRRTK